MSKIPAAILLSVFVSLTPHSLAAGEPTSWQSGPAVRAQLRPTEHAVISAGMAGRIATFDVSAGDRVEADQRVGRFDCRLQQAEYQIAVTKLDAAETQHKINQRLQQLDNISNLNLSMSEAEASIARSELGRARALLSECDIRAPFGGQVIDKLVQAHEHVTPGQPLFELVDTGALEVEMVLASTMLTAFPPGATFFVVLDETGTEIEAQVTRQIGSIDPVSQTIKIVGSILTSDTDLLPGMSGTVRRATTIPTSP